LPVGPLRCFIHRDDKATTEGDKPSIVEILVEKHRNGPTGKVDLYFDKKRTSYVSVDKSGYGELANEF
jgi:replicative DNA helicase